MNAEPFQRAWAKLAVAPDARRLWHSLVAHGIDVAATFEALCETPAIRLRLQAAAERTLSRRDIARLGVFAALHDFGKANRGFWGRQFDPGDLRRERDAGHIAETCGALYGPAAERAQAALGFERIADWGGALEALIIATLSHHGSPAASRIRRDVVSPADLALWSAAGSYDPIRELERLRDAAFAMFPEAFAEGPPLPDAPRFVHLFAGLLMLADWIGSDPASFPLGNGDDADRIAFARGRAPALLADFGIAHLHGRPRRTTGGFEALFGWPPRALQEALGRIGDEPLVILEAETGSGKTEAALWHFVGLLGAGLVDGLYFALPTRVAAAEIHGRVTRAADALFGEGTVKPVLAVPGYIRAGAVEGRPLPEFRVLWPDHGETTPPPDGRWAAERPKRFLAAAVAVGTVDQAFLAGLQTGHAHLRAAALSRSLLVVDEVHASDPYMTSLLKQVLDNHLALGGRALLMSATLGAAARAGFTRSPVPALAEAIAVPYPAVTRGGRIEPVAGASRQKAVAVDLRPLIPEPEAVAALAADAARAGATVVVIRNTVGDALATQAALERLGDPTHLFRAAGQITLHHGRFAAEDRRLLDAEVSRAFGRGRDMAGRTVVGTQTLEQSLDIDADLLVTDLCPMDVLLQRIGRLHRHGDRPRPRGYEGARAVVLVPATRDLSPFLLRPRHGLGHGPDGEGVYPDMRIIEATLRLLEAHRTLAIPAMNRALVEGATHPDALEAVAADLGWRREASLHQGKGFAAEVVAAGHSLDMSRPFESYTFPASDETVRTRLGLDDLQVDLAEPALTPFGHAIQSLRIPAPVARAAGLTGRDLPEAAAVENGPEGFGLPELRLRYSRIGLTVAT